MPIHHEARRGDCVGSLAYEHGFFPGTIWEHPENRTLRELRCNQNTLAVRDVVYIPDRDPKELGKPDQQRHVFRRRGVPAIFRIQLMDDAGPQADVPFRVILDGTVIEGRSDEDGMIEVALDPSVRSGELLLGETDHERSFDLRLGHLEPIDAIDGAQQRLNNLGFPCPVSGQLDEGTQAAVRVFQDWAGVKVTGELDDATRTRLNELHDTPDTEIPEPVDTEDGGAANANDAPSRSSDTPGADGRSAFA